MLQSQFRMHPDISAFPSKRFYEGKLRDGGAPPPRPCASWPGALGAYVLVDAAQGAEEKAGSSYANMYEAQLVASMVTQFAQRFKIAAHRIGIITFYSGQVAAIKV